MALLRSVVLLLALVVMVHGAPRRGGGKKHSPELRACFEVLKPAEGRDELKTKMDTCVGEQEGLQATIDGLKETVASERGGRGRRGGRRGGRGGGSSIKLLDDAGNTAEAETLKKCLAREFGHLTTDGTEAFDVEKFKTEITDKAAGTDNETNIQMGLDNCSDEDLTNFDVHPYMKCVAAYCATGEAPPTDAPTADDADTETIEP